MLEIVRRRVAVLMLVALPLIFYWTSSDAQFATTFATVGAGWALSIATLFLSLSMRRISPRLGLVGFTVGDQLLGRLLCALLFGLTVGLGLWLYIGLDDVIVDHQHLAMSLILSAIGSIAAGLAVGALIPREMEAMLVLIAVVGLQFVVDSGSGLAKILPLYAAERYAASASGWAPNIGSPWIRSLTVSAVLFILAVVVSFRRQRIGRSPVVDLAASGSNFGSGVAAESGPIKNSRNDDRP